MGGRIGESLNPNCGNRKGAGPLVAHTDPKSYAGGGKKVT